ncbi:MAG: NlpC/P60 family protein [Rhodoglobus sp.]
MPSHARSLGLVTAVLLAGLIVSGGPAAAEDYPSWDDVQAAQQSATATQAAISEIETILVGLQQRADALGRVSLQKGEAAHLAQAELEKASAQAKQLDQQAQSAADRAAVSNRRAGQLLAQIARAGGGSLSLELFLSPNAGDLLGSLGTMTKVVEQADAIYRQAQIDTNLAKALTAQARAAEKERAKRADLSEAALTVAQAAADAAVARVNQQREASEQLYSQLSTLKGTTAELEQQYLAGLVDAANGAQAPTPSDPGDSPSAPPAASPPPVPGPSAPAASAAIAYAADQLGEMYQFGGMGPSTWDCSGLTKAAYASVGVYVGTHSATDQYNTMAAAGRLVPLAQLAPGDLIFYADGGTLAGGIYHVALYVGGGQMIEAPYDGVPVRRVGVRYYDALAYAGRPTA